MPTKPIGDFPSVGEAKAYCKSLLSRGDMPLTDEEHARVSLLMPYHPDYKESWQLCRHLSLNGEWYSFCVFGDDIHWPTSYHNFFKQPQAAENDRREVAYRHAIKCQIDAYKTAHDGTGEVDHQPPGFAALVEQFEREIGFSPTPIYDQVTSNWELPEGVKEQWQAFHQRNACLQLLSACQHKEITAKRRRQG